MRTRVNMKRIVLLLLAVGLVLPVALFVAPEGVSSRLAAFFKEDLQREQALSAAVQQSAGAALSRFSDADSDAFDCAPGERYIVRFAEMIPEEELLAYLSGVPYRLLAQSDQRLFLVALKDAEAFCASCGDALLYCCEDRVLQASEIPSDPLIAERSEYAQLELFSAWEQVTPSSDILVAVLDTGVDRTHEDLIGGTILDGYDVLNGSAGVSVDRDGHGTAVTGLIAATANNGVGSAGVAYGVRILPVRVARGSTNIYSSDMISGIRFAADAGARILNLSLGGYTYSAAEYDAVRYATERGCILLAAAGNDGETDRAGNKVYPASYPGVISVGSCDASGTRSSFSQMNEDVDLLAPGEELLLLVAGGKGEKAYRMGSGTSYSTALMSGVAALALSALDDGVRLGGEELLVLLADNRSKRVGSGYGTADALQAVTDVNLPLITGVENGKSYSRRVTIRFNRGTATLDGEEFFDGGDVYRSGGHTLVVTDGENRQTVSFRILYTPATYEMTETDRSVIFTYTGGTATVDGFPYESGDEFASPGWHVFRLTDAVGDVTERSFYCDYRLPLVSGVEDGGIYDRPVRIRMSGRGEATLDGEPIGTEAAVFANGAHTLTVSNGGESRTIHFTLATDVQIYENTVTRSGVICDEAGGWYGVYSDMLSGIRVFSLGDGEFLSFLDTETVRGYAFAGDRLLIFGEWCLTVLDPARMGSDAALLASYFFRCEGFAYVGDQLYCLSEGTVYTVMPEEGGWTAPSSALSLTPLFETDAEEVYTDGTALWLYSIGANRFDRYEAGALTSFTPFFDAAGERKYFTDGWLFCGEYAVRLADFSPAFTFGGYAVGSTDSLLFTTEAVYRISDGVRVGSYQNAVSCVLCTEESVFVCGTAGGISRYSASAGYGYAPEEGSLLAGKAKSNLYTDLYALYGQAKASDTAAAGDRFGATFGEERKLLLFRNGGVELEVSLPFMPAGLCLTESRCAVLSADGRLLWVDGALYHADVPLQDAFFLGEALYLLGNGRLFLLEAGVWTDTGISADAAAGAGETLVWLSGGTLFVRSGGRRMQTACAASSLYTDGTYILADRTVYRVSNLSVAKRLNSDILALCGRTVLTTDGLYALDPFSCLSTMELGTFSPSDACLGSGCGLVLSDSGRISVSGYSHPVWEMPTVSGAVTGMRYEGQTTIRFDRGQGYLDGVPCSSGTRVTEAGTHTLTLVLPCSIVHTYSFSVAPALESITFTTTIYRLTVGESGRLHVRYAPAGATVVPVIFSTESDCIQLEENGSFTALHEGIAVVTAQTVDGRLQATGYVVVQSEVLRFSPESGYRVDRNNDYLYGIPVGTSSEELLAQVVTNGDVRVSTEIVGTGTEILLLSADGEEIDKLIVVIKGDLDGDGYVTLRDLLLLEKALENGEELEELLLEAADLNGSGSISDQDANLLKRMLLRFDGDAGLGTPSTGRTGTVGLFLPSVVYAGNTVYVTIYLKDSTRASCAGCEGVSGRLRFDRSALTYLGAETYGWEVSLYESGGQVSYLAYGDRSTGTLPIVTLRFSVNAEAAGEELTLRLRDGVVLFKDRAYGLSREDVVFTPEKQVYGDVDLQIVGMTDAFSPDRSQYQVRLPAGTPALDYTLCYPIGTTVTVRNTVFDRTDELDAIFSFRLPGGEKLTYTVHASRDGAPLPDSDSRLASLTAEEVDFSFNPSVTLYHLTVPHELERLVLHWETMNDEATAVCNNPPLVAGRETDITVTVTAADGSVTVYTLRVYRQPEEEIVEPAPESESSVSTPQKDTSPSAWYLLVAALLLLVGGGIVFFVRTRRGAKQDHEQEHGKDDDTDGNAGMDQNA